MIVIYLRGYLEDFEWSCTEFLENDSEIKELRMASLFNPENQT
jgi:hypothetical protein